MSRLGRILGRVFGGSPAAPARRTPSGRSGQRRAGYDAAKTNDGNRKHWAEADDLAAVGQLTPAVRGQLRKRARHEFINNCYFAGVVRTIVVDTVGTGARLQMLTPDVKLNAAVEWLWRVWAGAVDWPLTSRVLCGVELLTGECFGAFRDSKRLEQLGIPVTLDVRLIEPDQVADPAYNPVLNATGDDGIVCDADGDVIAYRVLKNHPGDTRVFQTGEATTVDARNMIHWFRPDRPGQLRGVTSLAPALPIAAQLRRFSAAVLTAAEVAAMLAGVLELPDGTLDNPSENPTYETMDTIELVRGMLLTVPGGGKVSQFKPEQPTTNYEMFVAAKLREMGRSINMPFGKVAGDHSRYNYSSGRMDDAPYWSEREIHRQGMEAKGFRPTLFKWFDFAKHVIPGLIAFEGKWWSLPHRWQYDARPVTDGVKDATTDEMNLTNGSDTLESISSRDGTTVEDLIASRKRTKQLFEEAGLPLPPWMSGAPAPLRVMAPEEPIPGTMPNPNAPAKDDAEGDTAPADKEEAVAA